MDTFYVLAAVLATPAAIVVAARYVGIPERMRYRMRLVLGRLGMFGVVAAIGCSSGPPEIDGGAGGGSTTTTTATATGCAAGFADCGAGCVTLSGAGNCGACGVVCADTQSCGPGCGSGFGCFTPGGTLDAGPNDCPACFADPSATLNCSGPSDVNFPRPFFCQLGASIGGCIKSMVNPSYICCPMGVDGGQ